MRTFALRSVPLLGLVLSLLAASTAQAVEPSVRRVSLQVGETFRTSASQVRSFAVDPAADAAELTVTAEQFSLEGRHPGQTALVLIDNSGQARLLVVDVVGGPSTLAATPPVAPAPKVAPGEDSAQRADRAREAAAHNDLQKARAILKPALQSSSATHEELVLLRAVCRQMQDKVCAEETAKKLASQ